jgi:hypothetical protein
MDGADSEVLSAEDTPQESFELRKPIVANLVRQKYYSFFQNNLLGGCRRELRIYV